MCRNHGICRLQHDCEEYFGYTAVGEMTILGACFQVAFAQIVLSSFFEFLYGNSQSNPSINSTTQQNSSKQEITSYSLKAKGLGGELII